MFVISAFYMADNNGLQGVLFRYSSKIRTKYVYTDQIEHTARRYSAWLPPIQCTLSGHQCMMLIQV